MLCRGNFPLLCHCLVLSTEIAVLIFMQTTIYTQELTYMSCTKWGSYSNSREKKREKNQKNKKKKQASTSSTWASITFRRHKNDLLIDRYNSRNFNSYGCPSSQVLHDRSLSRQALHSLSDHMSSEVYCHLWRRRRRRDLKLRDRCVRSLVALEQLTMYLSHVFVGFSCPEMILRAGASTAPEMITTTNPW